jgi:glycosyltransferase involved in cell wall biosynthesis
VRADGRVIGSLVAEAARPDAGRGGRVAAGFSAPINVLDQPPRAVELVWGNRVVARARPDDAWPDRVLLSSLEQVTDSAVEGWLVSPDRPGVPATAVLTDGHDVVAIRGAHPRDDVYARHGCQMAGFRSPLASPSRGQRWQVVGWEQLARSGTSERLLNGAGRELLVPGFHEGQLLHGLLGWCRTEASPAHDAASLAEQVVEVVACAVAHRGDATVVLPRSLWATDEPGPTDLQRAWQRTRPCSGNGGSLGLCDRCLVAFARWQRHLTPPGAALTAGQQAHLAEAVDGGTLGGLPRLHAIELRGPDPVPAPLVIEREPAVACRAALLEETLLGRGVLTRLPRPEEAAEADEITVIGLIGHASAVGAAADDTFLLARQAGLPTRAVPLELTRDRPGQELGRLKGAAGTALLHIPLDRTVDVVLAGADHLVGYRRRIGHAVWETAHIPLLLRPALRVFDELWTPSEFTRRAFASVSHSPVHVLPPLIRTDVPCGFTRPGLGIDATSFVVHVAFDANSGIRRKNPLAAVEAFRAACDDEEARLILKVRNAHVLQHLAERHDPYVTEFLSRIRSDARILLVADELTHEAARSLLAVADCHLSMHRSEGFGNHLAEAMGLGLPTVATSYSGNLDFMNAQNSWLVDHTLVPLGEGDYAHVEDGMLWAEPSIPSAVVHLQEVRAGAAAVRERAERGRALIVRRFSLPVVAQRFAQLARGSA